MLNSKNFYAALQDIPLRVIYGMPSRSDQIIVYSSPDEITSAVEMITKEAGPEIVGICLHGKSSNPAAASLNLPYPLIPPGRLASMVYAKVVSYTSSIKGAVWDKMTGTLNSLGVKNFVMYSSPEVPKVKYRKLPNAYLDKHMHKLIEACNLLENEASKELFLRFVKARVTGELGYIIKSNEEYNFPLLPIQQGKTMLNGGVSESIAGAAFLAKLLGNTGKMYAFEPEPTCYAQARQKFQQAGLAQVELVKLGMWSEPKVLHIEGKGSDSRIVTEATLRSTPCELTAIDLFVAEKGIPKVDYIKLDIEGSELEALKGGRKTIEKDKPNLILSIYHKQTDIYSILLFIHSLNLGYKYYLGQESWRALELVLYAIIDE